MAKTRLNNTMRERLHKLAMSLAIFPDEEEADNAAYESAEALVRAAVHSAHPPKDMAVLQKYGVAQEDACRHLVEQTDEGAGRVRHFIFRDDAPMAPSTRGWRCHRNPIAVSVDTMNAVEASIEAASALEDARKEASHAFWALFRGCRYFCDVAEAWPAAAEHKASITGAKQLPVVALDDAAKAVSKIQMRQADA